MNNKPIQQNLKHGYIFLTGIILVLFSISFSTEMYLNGAFAFDNTQDNKTQVEELVNENANSEEVFLKVQNLESDFKTKEEQITVVVFTNIGNKAWINQNEIEVNDQGIFEGKVDLIIGKNEIIIEVKSPQGESIHESITVIREAVEKPQKEVVKESPKESKVTTPSKTNPPTTKTKSPVTNSTPKPPEPPLTGLKLQCSITNTQPSVDQTVILDCLVTDQNNKAVSGATGSITVDWQSGVQSYALSNSSSSGNMNKSFVVPRGNSGNVIGSVRVSKSGLVVTSNFNLTVH